MKRTVVTPCMIETYKSCKKLYKHLFVEGRHADNHSPSSTCKKFLLKALSEIHKGRIANLAHIQKFLGLSWPADKFDNNAGVKSFLFAYKALNQYLQTPYFPSGARIVGVDLNIRARLPHEQVYVEDTFDLILYFPDEKRLEFVDFHFKPLKAFDPSFPPASILVKQFLAERLALRFPFTKLTMTFGRLGEAGVQTKSFELHQSLYKLQWAAVSKEIIALAKDEHSRVDSQHSCIRCRALEEKSGTKSLAVLENGYAYNATA